MSENTYASAAGFIQFPVEEKEVNGKDLREFVIRGLGSQKLIKVTLWDEWAATEVKKGDFVAVDGKFESSLGQAKDGSQREYLQITAYSLIVTPGIEKAERDAVVSKAKSSDEPLF
jgi:hypothetical protein